MPFQSSIVKNTIRIMNKHYREVTLGKDCYFESTISDCIDASILYTVYCMIPDSNSCGWHGNYDNSHLKVTYCTIFNPFPCNIKDFGI